MQDMREAVTSLQSTVAKREVQDLSNRLAALAPIKLPANTSTVNTAEKMHKGKDMEEPADIGDLITRCNKARELEACHDGSYLTLCPSVAQ